MGTVAASQGAGSECAEQPPAEPGGPWSVRLAGCRAGRPAVEIYEGDVLLDIVTAQQIAPRLLHGGRRAGSGGSHRTIAWGRRPAGPGQLSVQFGRGRHARPAAEIIEVTSWCWLAVADGSFGRVSVSSGSGVAERRRITAARSWS